MKSVRNFFLVLVSLVCFSLTSVAQQVQPAPDFRLINAGYGAAALGMGGAFTAIANDLSALDWNPAGLAQLHGWQVFADYQILDDSDSDFSEVVLPDTFISQQRFSDSGNNIRAAGVSYQFKAKSFAVVPAFSWQRFPNRSLERELKDTAGFVSFVDGERLTFFQSEALFKEKVSGDDEVYSFGAGVSISTNFMIGGSWNLLAGGPETTLEGTFHDSFVSPVQVLRTDTDLTQSRNEEVSGNYFKFGVLAFPIGGLAIGGTVRLPYTQESDISLERRGPFTFENTTRDVNGNVISIDTGSGTLQQTAFATSQVELPVEFSIGIAARTKKTLMLSGSITYAGYSDTVQVISNSTDPLLLPETTLRYPTLRPGLREQPSLLQWRGGVEYTFGTMQSGFVMRTGIFYDGQPYANVDEDRTYFNGYTFGAGYVSRTFKIDAAFVSEEGDKLRFTPADTNESHFKNRRWVFGLSLIS